MRPILLAVLAASILVTFSSVVPAAAEDARLAKAEDLLRRGRFAKAAGAFESALLASEEACVACCVGLVRSYAALGRFDEAARALRVLSDLYRVPSEEEVPKVDAALLEELAGLFRDGLAQGERGALMGLFDVLASLGKSGEIVRLVAEHLIAAGPEEQVLLCAADYRGSAAPPAAPLAFAEELNRSLTALGWTGPFLLTPAMRAPQQKTRGYTAGRDEGVRLAGAVDKKGTIEGLRVVRPYPPKEASAAFKAVESTYFDSATWSGRRLSVCFPLTVAAKGREKTAAAGGPTIFDGLDTVDAIVQRLEEMELADANPFQRAQLCGVELGEEHKTALNEKLIELEWPGPFFLAGRVVAPSRTKAPKAEYTKEAKQAGIEGSVEVTIAIDQTGRVHVLKVTQELEGGLTEAAVKALEGSSYDAPLLDGKKVPVCKNVAVEFALP